MAVPGFVAPLVDIGLGLLGAGGQAQANRTNVKLAREQMAFQREMSSTAAQRSVEDFRKAGLNPALAYGHQASSPGGASAVVGDAASKGIATAQAARELRQNMAIARDVASADVTLKGRQAAAAENSAALLAEQARSEQQRRTFEFVAQPYQLRQEMSRALLAEAGVPWAQLKSGAADDLSRVRSFIRSGASRFSDVPPTASAWIEATRARLRGAHGPRMRFDAAPPRKKGGW